MNRQSILIVAGFATFLQFLTGCSGFSSYRDDLAIQAMAKRSFARREASCPIGPFSKDYERGWRQAYFDISHGGTGCPPSVPPEVYWSTKYQNSQGCQHITAWYDGYRFGAEAALAECRSSFAKVPVMANCIRPSAMECSPVQPCREPAVTEWQQFSSNMPVNTGSDVLAEDGQSPSPVSVYEMPTENANVHSSDTDQSEPQSVSSYEQLQGQGGTPSQLPAPQFQFRQPTQQFQPTAQVDPFRPLNTLAKKSRRDESDQCNTSHSPNEFAYR